jgi:exopolysaccharide production protein ExoZ
LICNLQTLRVLAASGVVVYHSHATFLGNANEFHGVALFFILSGYLMCRISQRSEQKFISDRLWRIVPSYWIATILLLALFNMWTYWPPKHVLLSLLFVPHDSPSGYFPVLGIGWTLNLEVYFYSVFAISIYLHRKLAPIITAALIASVYFLLPHLTTNEPANFYFGHNYVWYFLIGIGIWFLTELMKASLPGFKIHIYSFPILVALFVLTEIFLDLGFVSVCILFFASVLISNHGGDLNNKTLLLLGNSSYACYLLHTILIEFLRHNGIPTSGSILFTTFLLLGSWIMAVLWFLTLEKYIIFFRRAYLTRFASALGFK